MAINHVKFKKKKKTKRKEYEIMKIKHDRVVDLNFPQNEWH